MKRSAVRLGGRKTRMRIVAATRRSASIGGSAFLLICAGVLILSARPVGANDAYDAALAKVRADEARRVEVLARAARAVVCVYSDDQRGGGGSGVIIDPQGYGLTNFHVVQPFVETRRGFGGLCDGRLYPLRLLGIDPGGDIAMFKLEGRASFDHVPLGDSDALRVGQWVAAMGNPFLLAEDFAPTITVGVISGLHRYQRGRGNLLEYADCIQVSTSINPGNSGGPLFDLDGRVIGINGRASFKDDEQRTRVNVGLGYAVSINQIKRFMPGLRAGRLLEHGTLGATVRRAGDELIISAIQSFSPAERAGVRLGDELLEIAGRRVRTANDYNNLLAIMPADWPITLRLRRDGQLMAVATRLERLALRVPFVYVPDLEHNHTELARILDRHAERAQTRVAQPVSHVTFEGRFGPADQESAEPFTVVVRSPETATAERDGQPAVVGPLNSTLREEWRLLALPLLFRPQIGVDWELLGGDEVDGRIVNVVERRPDDARRIRWKFDWQTDRLVEVSIGSDEESAAIVWSPGRPESCGQLDWPSVWKRCSSGGGELLLQLESITPASEAEDGRPGRRSGEAAE